jgi:hypothetical protein
MIVNRKTDFSHVFIAIIAKNLSFTDGQKQFFDILSPSNIVLDDKSIA